MNTYTKNLAPQQILTLSKIGFEFEFFINDENVSKDIIKLQKLIEKNLSIKVGFNEGSSHKYDANKAQYTLTYDGSGGNDMYEFITPPLNYNDAVEIANKMLDFLQKFGNTTVNSSMHINVSFTEDIKNFIGLDIENILIDNFIDNFDENYVYQFFPNRKNNIYCRSVKNNDLNLCFKNRYLSSYNSHSWNAEGLKNYLKYYGVNFNKIVKNYIEFRYIGGEGYEKKKNDILRLVEFFVISIYRSLELQANKIVTTESEKDYQQRQSYAQFVKKHENIKFYVDMHDDYAYVTMFAKKFLDIIELFLLPNKVNEGSINIDTDRGFIEFKDIDKEIKSQYITTDKIAYYSCKLNNVILVDAELYDCDIKECIMEHCYCYERCNLDSCILLETYTEMPNKLENCKISNTILYSGIFNNCFFRKENPIVEDSKITDCEEKVAKEEDEDPNELNNEPKVKELFKFDKLLKLE